MDQQKPRASFTNEISGMMFGFGDSNIPNPETVQLVENITLKQLHTIIYEALKVSAMKNIGREGKVNEKKTEEKADEMNHISGEDLVFLMRHNKYKMRRFVKYLHNKKLRNINLRTIGEIDLDEKPKDNLLEFIERIDETGEYADLTEMDEVKYMRQLRASRISEALNEQQYLEFCKARSSSFSSKHIRGNDFERLKSWIDPSSKMKFSKDALEVLAYLAYQTVAEITDYALLIRMDSKCNHNPLSHSSGSYYTATMFNCAQKFGASNMDYSKVYSGQAPISVNEIKEVMRRVHSPQAGTLNFGGKRPEAHYCFAL